MIARVLFVLCGLLLGGAVAATHRFVPPVAGLRSWASSALVGALFGTVVACVLLWARRRLARAIQDATFTTRLLNSR
jgi:hypothetical protein